MQVAFTKSQVTCLKTLKHDIQHREETQELRLPEELPDIGRILACWGQPVLRGKEWRKGSVHVSGGVMVWILYVPEEDTQPRQVETWIPFQMKWELPETDRDGIAHISPELVGVDARCISARKMVVRCGICAKLQAMLSQQVTVSSAEEVPDHVELLENTYPMMLPAEAGEKPFAVDMELSLVSGQPEKLISFTLQPELHEQKLVADKLVFRGIGRVHVLYCTQGGMLCSEDLEVPFSQYAELEKEYPDNAVSRIHFAVTNLEMHIGETGKLDFKAGLTGQYMIYDCQRLTLAEDAYSPGWEMETQIAALELPALLDTHRENIPIQALAENISDVLDMVFYPEQPQMYWEDGSFHAEPEGMFQVLYQDMEGVIQCALIPWSGSWSLPSDKETTAQSCWHKRGSISCAPAPGGMMLQADSYADIYTEQTKGLPMITSLTLGERVKPDGERPSLILCKCEGETLWNLAKKTGSTVKAIRTANGLEGVPESGRILLIPVL